MGNRVNVKYLKVEISYHRSFSLISSDYFGAMQNIILLTNNSDNPTYLA